MGVFTKILNKGLQAQCGTKTQKAAYSQCVHDNAAAPPATTQAEHSNHNVRPICSKDGTQPRFFGYQPCTSWSSNTINICGLPVYLGVLAGTKLYCLV